jgi:hypothetical protein
MQIRRVRERERWRQTKSGLKVKAEVNKAKGEQSDVWNERYYEAHLHWRARVSGGAEQDRRDEMGLGEEEEEKEEKEEEKEEEGRMVVVCCR